MGEVKPAFTPGPWEAEYEDDGCSAQHVIRMASALVNPSMHQTTHAIEYQHGCFWDDDDAQKAEAFANAQLIAAAPDLYAACEAAMNWLDCFGENFPETFGGEAELYATLNAALQKARGEVTEQPLTNKDKENEQATAP